MKKRFILTQLFLVLLYVGYSDCTVAEGSSAKNYALDRYNLTWHVEALGDINFDVQKTEATSLIIIDKKHESTRLDLTLSEAIELGNALSQTRKYYEKLRFKDADTEETLKTEKGMTVTFRKSEKFGFYISIMPKESYSTSFTIDDYKTGIRLSELLKNSKEVIDFLSTRLLLD